MIALIHRQQEIEIIKVLTRHLPRPQSGNIYTAQGGGGLRPWVRRITHMPIAGSRGIDHEMIQEPGVYGHLPENAFRHWRAADVAETNE